MKQGGGGGGSVELGGEINMEERDDGKARLRKTVTTSLGKRQEKHFPSCGYSSLNLHTLEQSLSGAECSVHHLQRTGGLWVEGGGVRWVFYINTALNSHILKTSAVHYKC